MCIYFTQIFKKSNDMLICNQITTHMFTCAPTEICINKRTIIIHNIFYNKHILFVSLLLFVKSVMAFVICLEQGDKMFIAYIRILIWLLNLKYYRTVNNVLKTETWLLWLSKNYPLIYKCIQ